MIYASLTIKDKEYKGRLNARSCVELEKKLGTNPLNVLFDILVDIDPNSSGAAIPKMPSLEVLITILHASLQCYEHSITIDKTYEIYDNYVCDGHTMIELVMYLIEVFKVSGFLPDEMFNKDVEDTDPNA